MNSIAQSQGDQKSLIVKIATGVALLFGLLTIFAGGSVIMDLFGMRAKEGEYVLFVVWASFLSGILYVFASYGFFKNKMWTKTILQFSIYILIAAFVVLIVWILQKEPYEPAIIVKLLFRIALSVGLYWAARRMTSR